MSTTSARPERPKLRALTGRVGGQALGGLLGLPRATTRYTVGHVRVPMRDGVQLVADHYAPATSQPVGTLLVRGPYGRRFPFSLVFARIYAARGYHVVLQSVRGTFGSGGVFEPMVNEAADGADTVAWLREQPWFTGRFGTIGLPYLGFTQWALLHDPPPELAAAVITVGPHDFRASVWGTGSFTVNDFLGWSDLVSHQEDPGRIRAGIRQLTAPRRVARTAATLPLGESARTLLGTGAPWFESWVEHTDRDDPFWDRLRFPAALDRVQVPVLLVGGWQDIFLRQTLQQYRHLRDRGVHVALTVGPWTHTQMLTKGLATGARESLDWLDAHLGRAPALRPSPVRVSEVDAKGRSRNVSDGYRRLGDAPELVRVELDAIAHRFRADSRIRVLIAGSWFPRYARNLGTPEPILTGRQLKPATHAVHFGRSRLLLPVG
ncbi:hydrolase [Mycobacterium tuberculosis]|nr:hydrolase [Mycobacterium tuberculosis]